MMKTKENLNLQSEDMEIKVDESYKSEPFDPDALLEVRHLRKCFPIKKSFTGKVLQELSSTFISISSLWRFKFSLVFIIILLSV